MMENYSNISGMLLTTLRKLTLYPAVHPVVKKALADTHNLMTNILQETETFTINVSPSGLLANNQIVTGKNQHLIDGLANELKRLRVESVTFLGGLSSQELEGFLRTLLSGNVCQTPFEHIKINEFSYIRVEKGKEIALKDQEEQPEKTKGQQPEKAKKSARATEDADALIGLLAKEFIDKKKFTSNSKNMIKKARACGLEKENLVSRIEAKCSGLGCPAEQLEGISGAIEEIFKPKEQTVKISASELKRLRTDKERMDNIIRNIADGLVVVDAEGKVTLMNPAAERILGIDKQTLRGKSLRDNISNEHLLALVKDLKTDKDGALAAKDIEIVTADESTKKTLRASSAVIENQDGKTVGMVAILNDITKQREIERLKSVFVANVSHELRTPLSVMQQNLTLLAKGLTGTLSDDQKKFIESSLDNLVRLRRLINDILDIAAIEAGKLTLNKSVSDINESAKKVVDFIKTLTKTKGISIDVSLPPYKCELEMDRDRIEQVMINLLGNAIKFTPEGGKISVCVEDAQSEVSVSVKDTGIGIKEEDIDRIFNKFEQIRPGYQSGIGGTGLGLPIAKEIIQLHQGRLRVESMQGEGSVFSFTLPKGGR